MEVQMRGLIGILAGFVLLCGCHQQSVPGEKQDDAEVNEKVVNATASNYEHLKELGWLVGSWIDQDENIVVTSDWKWAMNKNFLIQNFSMKVLDHDELQGRQIIGWDPVNARLHSWIFDSDGGFGESDWSKDGDSWFASTVYTLSDGRKASATHIYTKVGDNSYTFASQNRDVDGKVLPNIGPFKIIRNK